MNLPVEFEAFLSRLGHQRRPRFSVPETPLEFRADLTEELGVSLYLKREDQADDLGCGHKLRKLSWIVPEAQAQGATLLVTAGSLPSNQCKAVACMAGRHGLTAHILFLGDRQRRPTRACGNYLLTSLFQPRVTWLELGAWLEVSGHLESVAAAATARGERPFVIEPGASKGSGLLGSIELGFQTLTQLNPAVDLARLTFVVAAGSGGTALGLKLACEWLHLSCRVFGIVIGESAAAIRARQLVMRADLRARAGWGGTDDGRLVVTEIALGAGYDRAGEEEIATLRRVATRFGLLFDPNYMVKTCLGLQRLIAAGEIAKGSPVVLLHSGGQIGLFDENIALDDWQRRMMPGWLREPPAEA